MSGNDGATYKLTYFGIKGIAESIRFLLKLANIDFTDERLALDETWPQHKSSK